MNTQGTLRNPGHTRLAIASSTWLPVTGKHLQESLSNPPDSSPSHVSEWHPGRACVPRPFCERFRWDCPHPHDITGLRACVLARSLALRIIVDGFGMLSRTLRSIMSAGYVSHQLSNLPVCAGPLHPAQPSPVPRFEIRKRDLRARLQSKAPLIPPIPSASRRSRRARPCFFFCCCPFDFVTRFEIHARHVMHALI